jgi:hypothetical protein
MATTLTITGVQASATEITDKDRGAHRRTPLYGFWFLMEAGAFFLLLGASKSRLQRLKQLSLPGALLVTALIMAGCGAQSTTTTNLSKTYQVTITASAPASASGSSASMNLTQTVSLTVQ